MEEGRITNLQIAKIWASARELGMDREALYQLVPRGSIRGLSRSEASRLIDLLIQLGASANKRTARPRHTPSPDPEARPTQSQINFIHFLLGKLGWLEDPEHTRNFLRKYFHVESVAAIPTRRKAIAVIEALKAMVRRRAEQLRNPEGAGLRRASDFASPSIDSC